MICRAGKLTIQNKHWLIITNYDNNDPKSVDLNKRDVKILKKNIEFQFLKKIILILVNTNIYSNETKISVAKI